MKSYIKMKQTMLAIALITTVATGMPVTTYAADANKTTITSEEVKEELVIKLPVIDSGIDESNKEKAKMQSIQVQTGPDTFKTVEVEGMLQVKIHQDGISIENEFFGKDEYIYSVMINSNAPTVDLSYMGFGVYKITLQSGKVYTLAMLKEEMETQGIEKYLRSFISTYASMVLQPLQAELVLEKFDVYYSQVMKELDQTSISVDEMLNKVKKVEAVLGASKYQDNLDFKTFTVGITY